MGLAGLADWAFSCLLLSLRVAPVLTLAPPFSLTRAPRLFRVLLGLALSSLILSAHPGALAPVSAWRPGDLIGAGLRELFLGAVFVMALQAMFGALQTAGRTLDIQAGYGMALVLDPATRGQTPLVGALFAYAAGSVFFAVDGHVELMRIVSASLDAIPLGGTAPALSAARLAQFLSAVFVVAFGVAGGAILALFLTDAAIALMSRTLPQMNVLMLGFQIKTVVLLLTLPLSFGLSGALFLRMTRITLEAIPGLL